MIGAEQGNTRVLRHFFSPGNGQRNTPVEIDVLRKITEFDMEPFWTADISLPKARQCQPDMTVRKMQRFFRFLVAGNEAPGEFLSRPVEFFICSIFQTQ